MDRSLKWRSFFLVVIAALSFMMLMPTIFSSRQLPLWFTQVFNRKIQLGLDIQGGLHIVYSIDLNKAVDDKATEIKRELEAKLTDTKIKGKVTTPLHPIGAVDVVLDSPKDKARVEGDFLKPYDEIVVKRECDARAPADGPCASGSRRTTPRASRRRP